MNQRINRKENNEIKEQSLESKRNIVEIERDSVQIDKDINDDGNETKTSDDSYFYNTIETKG